MVTFKQLQEVDQMVGSLYKKSPELKDSKFGYAYKRFVDKNYQKLMKEFQHEINDARIDFAMEDDKTKELLSDPSSPRGFKYTKQGLKDVIKKENQIIDEWDTKEVEVTPHICPVESLPELTEEQREMLTGIVI